MDLKVVETTQEEIEAVDDMAREMIAEMGKDAAKKGLHGAEAFLWSTHSLPEIKEILDAMVERIDEYYTPPVDKDSS